MSQSITVRTIIEGSVDGERVAWAYRAFAETDEPYALILQRKGLPSLAITQMPSDCPEDEEDITPAEAKANDLASIAQWVEELTNLVAKSREYDDLLDALADAEEDIPVPVPVELDDDAFVVDALGDEEMDQEWSDCDGDHYKHINGQWHYSGGGTEPWRPLGPEPGEVLPDYLRDYGPYHAVGPA